MSLLVSDSLRKFSTIKGQDGANDPFPGSRAAAQEIGQSWAHYFALPAALQANTIARHLGQLKGRIDFNRAFQLKARKHSVQGQSERRNGLKTKGGIEFNGTFQLKAWKHSINGKSNWIRRPKATPAGIEPRRVPTTPQSKFGARMPCQLHCLENDPFS